MKKPYFIFGLLCVFVAGLATSASAFNFIENRMAFDAAIGTPRHPVSDTELRARYQRSFGGNQRAFLRTHPGSTGADYTAARRAALTCGTASNIAGFVTDGFNEGLYQNNLLRTGLDHKRWTFDGAIDCGKTVSHSIEFDASPLQGLDDQITVVLNQDLSTGILTANLDERASTGVSATIGASENIRTLDALFTRIETLISDELDVTMEASTAGLRFPIPAPGTIPPYWRDTLLGLLGLDFADLVLPAPNLIPTPRFAIMAWAPVYYTTADVVRMAQSAYPHSPFRQQMLIDLLFPILDGQVRAYGYSVVHDSVVGTYLVRREGVVIGTFTTVADVAAAIQAAPL